jgi:hypothetical protein
MNFIYIVYIKFYWFIDFMSAEKNLMNVENNLNALGTLEKNKQVL